MTPPLPASDRTTQINFRVSTEEADELRDTAERMGLTTSDFIRFAVQHALRNVIDRDQHALDEGATWSLQLKEWELERLRARQGHHAPLPKKKTKHKKH